jgi:hypothetical protein
VFGFSEFVLLMAGRPYLNLINTLLILIISAIGGILLIPVMGILGPPLAALVAYLLINTLRLVQVRVLVGVHPLRLGLAKPIVAFVAAIGSAVALQAWTSGGGPLVTTAGVALLFLIYVAAVWALGLGPAEREILSRIRGRFGRPAA